MKKKFWLIPMFLLMSLAAQAQCSICTKTASERDEKAARGINTGIIYLAFLPLTILGTLGYAWYRKNKHTI